MAERGAFNGIDVAMMVHPGGKYNWLGLRNPSVMNLDVKFWDQPPHASASLRPYPESGRNF